MLILSKSEDVEEWVRASGFTDQKRIEEDKIIMTFPKLQYSGSLSTKFPSRCKATYQIPRTNAMTMISKPLVATIAIGTPAVLFTLSFTRVAIYSRTTARAFTAFTLGRLFILLKGGTLSDARQVLACAVPKNTVVFGGDGHAAVVRGDKLSTHLEGGLDCVSRVVVARKRNVSCVKRDRYSAWKISVALPNGTYYEAVQWCFARS